MVKKGLNRLSLRFIDQVWMGESVLLREGIEGDDGFPLHVGQSLVIAIGETAKDDLLHRFCMLRFMILTERVVVFRAIDERDVDRDVSFSYQQVIDEDPADPSIPVNKGMDGLELKVKAGDPSDD